MSRPRHHVRHLIPKLTIALLFTAGIIFLAHTVAKSGYSYILDNDEVSHIQVAYLINLGYQPYRSFFSIYPPVFDWLLAPFLKLFGNSFQTIYLVRAVMVSLFFLRTGLTVILTVLLFGIIPGLLFIPLYFSDAFTVFSGMQIRPDNLMLTVFITGILLFVMPVEKRYRQLATAGSGALLALSVIILPKIAPGVLVAVIVFTAFLWQRRTRRELAFFIGGGATLTGLYAGWFAMQGTLALLIQNTIFDAQTTNNGLLYPVHLGSYYYSDNNAMLWGLPGKPPQWYYAWILPVTGFAGAYSVVVKVLSRTKFERTDATKAVLAATLVLQWGALFFINSVFLQYYIPITWLMVLFTGVLIWELMALLIRHHTLSAFYTMAVTAAVLILGYSAWQGNLARATHDNTQNERAFAPVWQLTAVNEPVFPNALFRPISYPLPYGYFMPDIPKTILERYPPLRDVLERMRVKHLFLSDYFMEKMSVPDQSYITTHYSRLPENPDIWVRNEISPL